jgi:hypothetical protein
MNPGARRGELLGKLVELGGGLEVELHGVIDGAPGTLTQEE